jgi:hypothetical protein
MGCRVQAGVARNLVRAGWHLRTGERGGSGIATSANPLNFMAMIMP